MPPLNDLQPAQIGLAMAFLQEGVIALAWVITGWLLKDVRRPAWHWASFSLLSGGSFLNYVVSAHAQMETVRLLGNTLFVGALLLQTRGLLLFTGQGADDRRAIGILVLLLGTLWLWPTHADAPRRVASTSAISALCCLWTSWIVWRHMRQEIQRRRWMALFTLPSILGALVLVHRAVMALLSPQQLIQTSIEGTSISLTSAMLWVLLSLSLQLTLFGLVIFKLGSQLRKAARHDRLTGLLNRHAMEDALTQERHRARRVGTPFSALMIDIDHFKQINDRLGHAAGDHTLRAVAQHLRKQLRTTDVVARWGGEEFLILLPGTNRAEAGHLADKLCDSLRLLPIPWGGQHLACTVSIGIAQWRPTGDTVDALLARADQALYRAKHDGRNQVCVEPTMVQTGHLAA